jgi:septal ring factor EnvC (AmiA/AmiB activator)
MEEAIMAEGCLQHEKVWQEICNLKDTSKEHTEQLGGLKDALIQTQMTNKQLCETLSKIEQHLDKNADIQSKMQTSLTLLTEAQNNFKNDLSDIKKIVFNNEDEHKIDTRGLDKKQKTDIFLKWSAILTPLGLIAYVVLSSVK